MGAVFLSASIPIVGRGDYYKSSDPMLIHAAVRALVSVVLGRRLIVWGGHPAITPMLWAAAEDLDVAYADAVQLYQSRLFEEQFPEENKRFKNCIVVEAVENDRDQSLRLMREKMISSHEYEAGVFVGGMDGLIEEFNMFRELQPAARVISVVGPGGAASRLPELMGQKATDESDRIDYVRMFYRKLGIDPGESRSH